MELTAPSEEPVPAEVTGQEQELKADAAVPAGIPVLNAPITVAMVVKEPGSDQIDPEPRLAAANQPDVKIAAANVEEAVPDPEKIGGPTNLTAENEYSQPAATVESKAESGSGQSNLDNPEIKPPLTTPAALKVTTKPNTPGPTAGKEVLPNGEKLTVGNAGTDVKQIIDLASQRAHPAKGDAAAEPELAVMTEKGRQPGVGDASPVHPVANLSDLAQTREVVAHINDPPIREQIDQKDIIQQIVKKAEVMFKSQLAEMKVHLKPDFLGRMLIRVAVEDGVVVAKIITENQHVKQILEANLNSLRQNLEANGLKVEKTEVSVQLFNDTGGYNGSENRYAAWPEQQQSRYHQKFYPGEDYGVPGIDDLALAEDQARYGISADGQVNFLV